jgi:hypothetical protein
MTTRILNYNIDGFETADSCEMMKKKAHLDNIKLLSAEYQTSLFHGWM